MLVRPVMKSSFFPWKTKQKKRLASLARLIIKKKRQLWGRGFHRNSSLQAAWDTSILHEAKQGCGVVSCTTFSYWGACWSKVLVLIWYHLYVREDCYFWFFSEILFYEKLKTSAVSTTVWMVETQLCKLRGTSDTFVRWTCLFYISFIIWFLWTQPTIWLLILSFTKNRSRVFYVLSLWRIYYIRRWLPWMLPGSTGRFSITILCTDTI